MGRAFEDWSEARFGRSAHARRQADLFYADLMGLPPRRRAPVGVPAIDVGHAGFESAPPVGVSRGTESFDSGDAPVVSGCGGVPPTPVPEGEPAAPDCGCTAPLPHPEAQGRDEAVRTESDDDDNAEATIAEGEAWDDPREDGGLVRTAEDDEVDEVAR